MKDRVVNSTASRNRRADAAEYWIGSLVINDEGQEHVASRDYFGYAIATFIVSRVNEDRSATLLLFDGDKVRLAGTVSIPLDHDIPLPWSIVVCGYIHAFKQSGCIHNAKYLGKCESIRAAECTTSQLKYSTEMAPRLPVATQ